MFRKDIEQVGIRKNEINAVVIVDREVNLLADVHESLLWQNWRQPKHSSAAMVGLQC